MDRCQNPATYGSDVVQVAPLHSKVGRKVLPPRPEEIRPSPSQSVVVDLIQRSQVQILPPLLKSGP